MRELDNEPQCTFRTSKAEGPFKIWINLLFIPLSMLVQVYHFFFQPCNCAIALLLSNHLMLQVWHNPWIMKKLLHSKFNIRRSFWNGFSLSLIFLPLDRTLRKIVLNIKQAIM